jgi:hypothetical protein
MPPPKQMVFKRQGKSYGNPPKTKRQEMCLNEDKVKILDLLKGSMSLAVVGLYYRKKNEPNIWQSSTQLYTA